MKNGNPGPVAKGDLPDDLDLEEPSDDLAATAALFSNGFRRKMRKRSLTCNPWAPGNPVRAHPHLAHFLFTSIPRGSGGVKPPASFRSNPRRGV